MGVMGAAAAPAAAHPCTAFGTGRVKPHLASSRACISSVVPLITSCIVAALQVCDGSGKTCAADGFAASGVSCRAANGACDVGKTCSGSSPQCKPDAFKAQGTSCRPVAPGDQCDLPRGESPQDEATHRRRSLALLLFPSLQPQHDRLVIQYWIILAPCGCTAQCMLACTGRSWSGCSPCVEYMYRLCWAASCAACQHLNY
jgi:hypothetical protein